MIDVHFCSSLFVDPCLILAHTFPLVKHKMKKALEELVEGSARAVCSLSVFVITYLLELLNVYIFKLYNHIPLVGKRYNNP